MDSSGVIFFESNYEYFLKPETLLSTIPSSFNPNQGDTDEPCNLSGHLHEGLLPVHRDLSTAPRGAQMPEMRNVDDS